MRTSASVPPALLSDLGLVFQTGKNGNGYVLRLGALGALAERPRLAACRPIVAVFRRHGVRAAATVRAVRERGRRGAREWRPAGLYACLAWSGRDWPADRRLADRRRRRVWDVDLDGRLFALRPGTGAQRFQFKVPANLATSPPSPTAAARSTPPPLTA